ncbi:MAG: nucleotidyltransferase family protein [Clostridia bacterium]|nr:nucleotidyltransferase family protein [Clostridia bacterium]
MKKLTTAVIMAGGQGTRLASITGQLPKAMVNIYNTAHENYGKAKDTILEHQIKMLSENGITNFVLVVGNKKEYIQNAFTNETINANIPGRNITIKYFEEERPLGTGGAFCSKTLREMIPDDDFLFTYADVLFDVNVGDMFKAHVQDNSDATVLISPCSDPDDRPLCVCAKGSNEIISLIPKQGKNDGPRGSIFPNTPKNGLMILNKSVFQGLPEDPTYIDMEEGILTKAIYGGSSKVTAWNTPCYVKDIGTVDRFYEGVRDLAANIPALKNPAKTPQHCIVYNESDLVYIDDKGNVSLNTQLSSSILEANEAGVITILNKDSEQLDVHPRADWVVDTLLARDGDGAFVNARYDSEQVEDLVTTLEGWNIPRENAYSVECLEPRGCLLTNLGTKHQEVQANVMGATYSVLETVAIANQDQGTAQ